MCGEPMVSDDEFNQRMKGLIAPRQLDMNFINQHTPAVPGTFRAYGNQEGVLGAFHAMSLGAFQWQKRRRNAGA